MPLVRYLLFAGSMLLGLLFLSDWYFPKPAAAEAVATDVDRSIIRIHSSHQWPVAVRINTSEQIPSVTSPTVVVSDLPAFASATPVRQAYAYMPPTTAK